MIMVRLALMHTILTSKKSIDGYSKLIFRSDLDKMKGSLKEKTQKIEELLLSGWEQCQAPGIDPKTACMAFGKFSVRLILLLLGKQKHGRDLEELETFQEVVELFGEELSGTMKASLASSGQEQNEEEQKIENLLQASAADMAMLQHPHIKQGQRYFGMHYCSG